MNVKSITSSNNSWTGHSLHLLLFLALSQVGQGQFTTSTPAPTLAPVSQAFTDGFMEGHRTMGMNIGYGKTTMTKPRANTGKGDLGDASRYLREVARFVDANWDTADDSGRGRVAGEVEAVVQLDQVYAGQMSQKTGIEIPNHTTEPGYFSAPNHLNGTKEHAVRLLNDTAAQLDTLNGDIAGDPAKKTGIIARLTDDDSRAADFVPLYNAIHMGIRAKHSAQRVDIALNNQIANSIKVASGNLANILVPTETGKNDSAAAASSTQQK